MEIQISLQSLLLAIYASIKIGAAILISKKEFKYPIWKNGVLSKRGIHDHIRAFIWHTLFNPEWAMLKGLAFIPVFLFTGYKFIDKFKPWRIQSSPPKCDKCKDKGKYYVPSLLKNKPGNWTQCECQKEAEGGDWFGEMKDEASADERYARFMKIVERYSGCIEPRLLHLSNCPHHPVNCMCTECCVIFLAKAIKDRIFLKAPFVQTKKDGVPWDHIPWWASREQY